MVKDLRMKQWQKYNYENKIPAYEHIDDSIQRLPRSAAMEHMARSDILLTIKVIYSQNKFIINVAILSNSI